MAEKELLLDRRPQVHPTAWVAPGAVLLGDVVVEEEATIWFNCVLRGDVHSIRVGKRSNVQDLTLCHGVYQQYPVIIGDDVTIGHSAIIHACVIENRCLIGMGAKILTGAVVGAESIVAAGAVVLEGQKIPPRSLVTGIPAKIKRQLSDEDVASIDRFRDSYLAYREIYSAREGEIAACLRELAPRGYR